MANEANEKKSGGGDEQWIWLFLVVFAAVLIAGRGGGFGGGDRFGGIKVGSPTPSGTREEEIRSRPALPPPLPSPAPPPAPPGAPLPSPPPALPPPRSEFSEFRGKAKLALGSPSRTKPEEEYVDLFVTAGAGEKILISGWTLENSRGERFRIPEASYFPFPGQVNPQLSIFLESGSRAHLITGRSPIGTNFRTNRCSGYFNQFHEFRPRLREECPRPADEPRAQGLPDECLDFIERLPICREVLQQVPFEISFRCKNYLSSEINYSKCTELHKNEPKFFKSEWYVYLERQAEIWKTKRETITLRDQEGKIIDTLSY